MRIGRYYQVCLDRLHATGTIQADLIWQGYLIFLQKEKKAP